VACISSSNGTGIATVSGITLGGGAGNFGSLATASRNNGITYSDTVIWADPSCAGGQTAVSISGTNLNAGAANGGVVVYEISGLAGSIAALLDKSASSTGQSASWTSSATATTTKANEIWIGVTNTSAGGVAGPGGAWTNAGSSRYLAGYDIVSSTGAATYNGTCTSGVWTAAVVTLIAGVAGGAQLLMVFP
jgi:hypothetical protein